MWRRVKILNIDTAPLWCLYKLFIYGSEWYVIVLRDAP